MTKHREPAPGGFNFASWARRDLASCLSTEAEVRLPASRVKPHAAAHALGAHSPMFVRESVMVGGQAMTFETGRLAKQAHGAVLVSYGESVVLVTAVSTEERPGLDFFPLTCEYVEKTYAAGRIPGGFFKREGRLRDSETLTSRLMDRPLRHDL